MLKIRAKASNFDFVFVCCNRLGAKNVETKEYTIRYTICMP